MSFGNHHSGGRTRMGTKVTLHIYDLSPANDALYAVGLGLHHSGVEISGVEYSYAQGSGIFEQTPKEVPNAKYRESVEMGTYEGGSSDLRVVIGDLRSDFNGEAYHLLKKNCNHFANAFCWALLGKAIPAHVNRLAEIGACCGCLLPKSLLEDSPVHAPGSGGFSMQPPPGSGRIMDRGGGGGASASSASTFGGRGMALGSSSNGATAGGGGGGFGITKLISAAKGKVSSGGASTDDLTDRRERARKAALARLEGSGGEAPARTSSDASSGSTTSTGGSGSRSSSSPEGYKRS